MNLRMFFTNNPLVVGSIPTAVSNVASKGSDHQLISYQSINLMYITFFCRFFAHSTQLLLHRHIAHTIQ